MKNKDTQKNSDWEAEINLAVSKLKCEDNFSAREIIRDLLQKQQTAFKGGLIERLNAMRAYSSKNEFYLKLDEVISLIQTETVGSDVTQRKSERKPKNRLCKSIAVCCK